MGRLAPFQRLRDHARDFPACREDFVRERAHQFARGAAVDQPDSALRDLASDGAELLLDRFLPRAGRAAIDADSLQIHWRQY